MSNYTQCHLTRTGMDGMIEHYHTYVPSKIAKKDNIIKLKNEDGTWDIDWVVFETFNELSWETVNARSQDYKNTRKASDI